MPAPTTTLTRPKLVPTSGAVEHTGLPGYRLRALVHRGMPCARVGTKFYFDLAEVDAWIDAHLVSAAGADAETRTPGTHRPADEWVAEQVAKFSPDDLRRAGELLLALANGAAG